MRAKTVNESLVGEVSYDEAVKFAKEAAASNPRKILGPSLGEVYNVPGEYYVQTGGISMEYKPEDIDELLNAMEIVETKHHNVSWKVYPGRGYSYTVIMFDSDEERKAGQAISQYYRDTPSGGYTGD